VVPPGDAMQAIADGRPDPALRSGPATAPLYEQAKSLRRRAAWSDLRKGVIMGAIGFGMTAYSLLDDGTPNGLGIVLLFVGSFGQLWLNTLLPTGFTGRWYLDVAADPSFRRAFASSLAVAGLVILLCLVVGLPLGYAVFRADRPGVRALARVIYQLPVALPALVLAFGFIRVFSSDQLPWLGSMGLLVAGHFVLGLPYFLQAVVADMQRLNLRLLETAAESLGANGWQRFLQIVLPSLRHSILSGLIVVAALMAHAIVSARRPNGCMSRATSSSTWSCPRSSSTRRASCAATGGASGPC